LKLSDYLEEDCIFDDLPGSGKKEIIASLVDALVQKGKLPSKEPFFSALLRRENLRSTAIGNGVAFPHARVEGLDKPIMALVRYKKGIGFGAIDNAPVHLIFFILMPEDATELQLNALAAASKLLRNPEVKSKMLNASDASEMFSILREADEEGY